MSFNENKSATKSDDEVRAFVTPRKAMRFEAVIFDMDGVVTRTAATHARAWKEMFDAFLRHRSASVGEEFVAFDHPGDYLAYVDGRPRYQGVATFLDSRGITLPMGTSKDVAGFDTVCALGNRKNEIFNRIVEDEGVGIYDSTLSLIDRLFERGIRVGLATSSRNAAIILGKSDLQKRFETIVDGNVSEKLGLKGKPEPDIFLAACRELGVEAARAVVVEDAVSGVQAGSRGGFALTVGLAREGNRHELLAGGADVVFADLAETDPEGLDKLVRERSCDV